MVSRGVKPLGVPVQALRFTCVVCKNTVLIEKDDELPLGAHLQVALINTLGGMPIEAFVCSEDLTTPLDQVLAQAEELAGD